jgi:hypothetical protein
LRENAQMGTAIGRLNALLEILFRLNKNIINNKK